MELSSLPLWAQGLGSLFVTVATAAWLTWKERSKQKDEPKLIAGAGDREVVAASLVGTRQMDDAVAVLRLIHAAIVEMIEHLEKANERAHEAELVAAAVTKIRDGRV